MICLIKCLCLCLCVEHEQNVSLAPGPHLHDPVQELSQHILPLGLGPLHGLQLHDHRVDLGHDAAD